MDLPAEKARNVDEHLDEELEKFLPLVRIQATIGIDLFRGERIHRVIAGLGFLSPSPFCVNWVKVYQTKKYMDFCRVFKNSGS
jgi:hypothetical protein